MTSTQEALDRLKNGNREFALSMRNGQGERAGVHQAELLQVQKPFAVILGCSDSRVAPEIIFSQGLGDLFVIRVAGTILEPSLVGSVEYAAIEFDSPLVVVLGHSRCGGVLATLKELEHPTPGLSPNLRAIVDRVRQSVEPLLQTDLRNDTDALVAHAVRANVSASVEQLRHGSALLQQRIRKNALAVVGAEYSLETGVVDFFDTAGAG
jgi:carbonic anhydrase